MREQENTSSEGYIGSKGPFSFHLAGLAVQLSWLYLLLYSGGWNAALTFTRATGSSDFLYLVSAFALCLTLLIGILHTKPFMRFAQNRAMAIIAPAIASLGTLSYCLISSESLPLAVIGGALTGTGSAFLWARWAAVFGRFKPKTVIGMCPLIVTVAVLICFTVGYLSPLLQAAFVTLLPAVSGAWLFIAEKDRLQLIETEGIAPDKSIMATQKETPPKKTAEMPSETSSAHHPYVKGNSNSASRVFRKTQRPMATKRHYAALVLFAAFLGFSTGILPAFSFDGMFPGYDLIFYSGVAVVTLLFVALAIFADDRRNFPLLFIAPTLVMLCVLLPFSHFAGQEPLLAVMGPLGSIAFELFLLIGSVLFARMTDCSPARTYMITRLSMSVFDALGLLCGRALMGQVVSTVAMQIAAVIMFLITEVMIAVLAYAYLSNRKGILGEHAVPEGANGNNATNGQNDSDKTSGLDGQEGPQAPMRGADSQGGADKVISWANPAEPAPSSQESDSSANHATTVTQAPAPSLEQRCREIAERYGLSAREVDVLQLVAQGRSYARIREDLTISQGTVNYHMSNLYAKLGVHSRQEVIDLVRGEAE